MTLYEYNVLDLTQRADYLWANGTLVVSGSDGIAAFSFYHLGDFFVEVVYDQEFNTIVSLVPFKTGPRYERMVEVMELPSP